MKTQRSSKFVKAAVAMLGVAFFAPGAHADGCSLKVGYSDLNLTTSAGAKVLYERIRTAAERVCGSANPKEVARYTAARICADQAIENGVRAVNSAELTEVANEHGYGLGRGFIVASLR